MKYIDADKLRAEIERRYAKYDEHYTSAGKELNDLLFFIKDLMKQDEPVTDCHDLTEAAEKYGSDYPAYNDDQFIAENAFIAGAEWGANHLRDTTKMMGDELEEIAENIYKVPFGTRAEDFKAGAEWQKRKMIEGAEEGEVQEFYRDEDGIHCCVSVGTDYKPGTIVYVITIPKEGEQ